MELGIPLVVISHIRQPNKTKKWLWPFAQEMDTPALTFWRRIFLQILAHPVFKMWVIQKPNKVALWSKRHFEEKKMEIMQHV